MNRRQIIIDNDGGTDDFVAILYAFLSKKFDVKGITLVAGNTDVENVKNNCFKALEMANVTPEEAKNVGIYLPERVNTNIISDGAQGDNGLGGVQFESPKGYEIGVKTAEDVLIETINNNPGEISIIATGPLTNIANVLKKNKDFVQNVDELVIMGGDEGGGNITPYAEFNIYQDPEAAKTVFEAGFKKITMIGFNITKQVTLCPEVETFLKQNGEYGKFLYDITRVTAGLDRGKNRVDGASMNDVLTLLYLDRKNEIFKTKKANVDTDISNEETRGQTTITDSASTATPCNVVTSADGTEIMRELLSTLFPTKLEDIETALYAREDRIASRDYLLQMLPEKRDAILSLWNREGAEAVMKRVIEISKETIAKRNAAPKGERYDKYKE